MIGYGIWIIQSQAQIGSSRFRILNLTVTLPHSSSLKCPNITFTCYHWRLNSPKLQHREIKGDQLTKRRNSFQSIRLPVRHGAIICWSTPPPLVWWIVTALFLSTWRISVFVRLGIRTCTRVLTSRTEMNKFSLTNSTSGRSSSVTRSSLMYWFSVECSRTWWQPRFSFNWSMLVAPGTVINWSHL